MKRENAIPREHELTAVVNRERFDEVPGGVTSESDLLRWRTFREKYHRAQNLEDVGPFPLQLDFELNSACNFACTFCVHGRETVPKVELPFEFFERAILEGQAYGLASIKLNYINEPLLSRRIYDAIAFARDHGVLNTYFATNGVLLDERAAGRLIDACLSTVMISLDAATPETFLLMRNSRQFDLVVKNIRRLIRIRNERGVSYPIVRVNFLKSHLNLHEIDLFAEQWRGVADMIGFQDQVGLPGVDEDVATPDVVEFYNRPGGFRCAFPFKLLAIAANGDILPCCTFSGREMPLGNLATTTIAEAWETVRIRELRKIQKAGRYAENPVCRHCIHGVANPGATTLLGIGK